MLEWLAFVLIGWVSSLIGRGSCHASLYIFELVPPTSPTLHLGELSISVQREVP